MRKLLIAAALITMSVPAFTADVSAETNPLNQILKQPTTSLLGEIKDDKPAKPPVKAPDQPKPVEYVVVEGDTLTKIGQAHSSTWLRLWQKNLGVGDPDVIKVGDHLTVPYEGEQLADRPLPIQAVVQTPATVPHAVVAGNTYEPGQCTWYVKNRRPDLPNSLGNANTWYSRAAGQGYATGTTPRAGAAGMRKAGMHVVYVEAVNADGSITISEMNYNYRPYSLRTRVANPGDYLYIY